jgi:2-oxoisovalerate dehydrogenase E1 component
LPKSNKTKSGRSSIARDTIIRDYRVAYVSRQTSLLGRREVFSGKAKFGIFGDGKEVAQLAMAQVFRNGDFRSGYYRDQTFMLAKGMLSVEEFFAQLYAHADVEAEPCSAGRSMTAHFGTRIVGEDGEWVELSESLNSSADVSPTASQMPRLVGLGYASKLFRQLDSLNEFSNLSHDGDEVAFGTIGNASCAEGLFWESINAIGVLQAPVLMSIWDDDYGISVSNKYQITGSDIGKVLSGFQRDDASTGFDIYRVKGWDYPALCETYLDAATTVRREHVPAIIHVTELTQPQGHSTSGSHERYKSKERLSWEDEFDCVRKMRQWMIEQGIAKDAELEAMEREDQQLVLELKDKAWAANIDPIRRERDELVALLEQGDASAAGADACKRIAAELTAKSSPLRRELMRAAFDAQLALRSTDSACATSLSSWIRTQQTVNEERYDSHLHSETAEKAVAVAAVDPIYAADAPAARGFEVMNACFDAALRRDPRIVAFGEDVGQLGDVNQGFAGLQSKYGELRVGDAGIREATILGQGIGLAMRGLRPIVEIQYLDYVLYALQIMSDDLATLHYRTRGGQKAPVIVRTRGHRLEGIWHSGSPMAGIINLVRGIHVCVPRDMTRAAGFYNTMLQSDDSALIIEVLNGYRLKEKVPTNIDQFTTPLGIPEVLRPGRDVTLVTYGACCRIALEATEVLRELGVDVELIDVQTLLPFDLQGGILESLQKTNRIVFLDEDVPGGATAYMMQQVIDRQGGYGWLDSPPVAISAKAHRPAYGSDGDYWSKPNREEIVRTVYALMHESDPTRYPAFPGH